MSNIRARTAVDCPWWLPQDPKYSTDRTMNNEYISNQCLYKYILPGHIPKVSSAYCSSKVPLDQNTMDCQDGTAMYLDTLLIYTVSSCFRDLDNAHVHVSSPSRSTTHSLP